MRDYHRKTTFVWHTAQCFLVLHLSVVYFVWSFGITNVEYVFGNKFCFYSFFSVFGKVANIAGRNRDCSFILEAVEHVTARSAYAFLSGI